MQTGSYSINDVLSKNATTFFIPPFQRSYAWGKTEIERYYSDVMRIINSELDEKQHDKLEHFFGTVVIKKEEEGFANKSVVVDGQQRLTTTLIFLIALRDLEEKEELANSITQIYLINPSSTFEDKIKLKQVTKDWDAYRALINKEDPNPGIIKNAYNLFCTLITDTKKRNPNIVLKHYITAISRMNVAVISLDERPFKGEDPQIIFETLNSLGKPLSLSDLVRNYVLLNLKTDDQSDLYEKVWHPQIEAVLTDCTSNFFRDYLQYKKSTSIKVVSDNNTKEIYQQFKYFVEDKFTNHEAFIKDIVRYAKWYYYIITETINVNISTDTHKNQVILELVRNIFHDIKAEAFKPFVLGLLEYHQSGVNGLKLGDDLFISILKTIRTYLIRRRILELTQAENKNIVLLCNKIDELVERKVSMIELLSNLFYRLRLPNDKEMSERLRTMNFYEMKRYSKFILGKIEENNTKVAVNFRDRNITIEHVMPQTLTEQWKTDLGENFNNLHSTYVNNIGNLILTEFNSEIGNKPFNEKKHKLNTSSLHYRLEVVNCEKWNEQSIIMHQNNMINWFLATFPLPIDYREANNWKGSNENEITRFSPLEEDAADMAEGEKPAELIIEKERIKVNTWQDVYIRFLKFIENSKNYDFRTIVDNQNDLLNKNDAIITWPIFSSMLDENIDLSKRYKTLEGKYWDKVENLNSDLLFILINISASGIINRISNIMNKLNMPEDSVTITLKSNEKTEPSLSDK